MSLSEEDWGLIEEVAQNIWSFIQRSPFNPDPPRCGTRDDALRMTAAAAIALGADCRGDRKEDFRDVARACAKLGGFDLALKDDLALKAELEYLDKRFAEEDRCES